MTRTFAILGGSVLTVIAVPAVLLFTPVTDPDLSARPQPAGSYADAVARIDAIAAAEASMDLQPEGRGIAMLTGAHSAKAVVLFHGYTTVPEQFRLIGQAYLAQGYNVWIPRLPHHGMANRMTDEFSRITATELREFADASVDIAAGLGDELTVVGLSGGGSVAIWTGFERAEVDHAILISPLVHPLGYADWQLPPMARALRLSPVDVWNWWSDELKENNAEGYDYPRFSLKGIGALLTLFQWTKARGKRSLTATFTLIRNDGDPRLDGPFNEGFVTRLVPADHVKIVRIPASEGLGHDLVAWQKHSECYPKLTLAYAYLAQAMEIPIPDPRSAG